VPIQAVAVRELVFDANGQWVREPPADRRRRRFVEPVAAMELLEGQTRKETEGVFVFRDGTAQFTPVKTGIAGERYFEVLSGLAEDDQVITGSFSSIRELPDGAEVRRQETAPRNASAP